MTQHKARVCANCLLRRRVRYDKSSGKFLFPLASLSDEEVAVLRTTNGVVTTSSSDGLAFTVRDLPTAIYIINDVLMLHSHHPAFQAAVQLLSYAFSGGVEFDYGRSITPRSPANLRFLPHQERAVKAISEIVDRSLCGEISQRGVVLGDDMGLGKTIVAAGVINTTNFVRSALVVCPASVVIKFTHELRKWITKPLAIIQLTRHTRLKHEKSIRSAINAAIRSIYSPDNRGGGEAVLLKLSGFVIVTNYEYVENVREIVGDFVFDLLICDEAHYLKNPNAQRTINLLGKHTKHEYIRPIIGWKTVLHMSGTPAKNNLEDMFMLLKSANPQEWSKSEFLSRYCGFGVSQIYVRGRKRSIYERFGDIDETTLDELRNRLYATTMIRRSKEDVLLDLPDKIRSVISIEPDRLLLSGLIKEKEILKKTKEQLGQAKSRKDKFIIRSRALRDLTEARRELALKKVPHVVRYVEENFPDDNVIVYTFHRDVAEKVAELLKCDFVHGDFPPHERDKIISKFKLSAAGGPTKIAATMHSCGLGIDLQEANVCIFAELDWVPSTMTQAEDRLYRYGQKKSVLCHYFVVSNSIDEKIAYAVTEKALVIGDALGDRDRITLDKPDVNLFDTLLGIYDSDNESDQSDLSETVAL